MVSWIYETVIFKIAACGLTGVAKGPRSLQWKRRFEKLPDRFASAVAPISRRKWGCAHAWSVRCGNIGFGPAPKSKSLPKNSRIMNLFRREKWKTYRSEERCILDRKNNEVLDAIWQRWYADYKNFWRMLSGCIQRKRNYWIRFTYNTSYGVVCPRNNGRS